MAQEPSQTPPLNPAATDQTADILPPSSSQPDNNITDEDTDDNDDYDDEPFKEERATIDDPIEPFNRAMHSFNDKLYFWLLKPAARGYKTVVPEPARVGVKNFFSNLKYPVRFVSCLLEADFAGAATETGRFVINTIWGMGGLMDPSAGKELDLRKQDTDLGQTLGVYGVGHGFYIVWPFFGPSSPRDSVSILGNQVLYPLSFLNIWYASIGIKAFETVNSTSLRIGDYEALVEAAIDPYVAVRDAYAQYRMHEVKTRKAKSLLFKDASAGANNAAPEAPAPQE
jgi:phospholipid-binding lipoprotein MlaA